MTDRKAQLSINAIKNEYSESIHNAKVREKKAEEKQKHYNNMIQHEQEKIDKLAEKKISAKIIELEHEYTISATANKSFWNMILMFSVILTVMLAMKNVAFINDLIDFSIKVDEMIYTYINGYSGGANNVIGMIIGTVLVVAMLLLALWLYTRYLEENDINIIDEVTAIYSFLSLSVTLFVGEQIQAILNINLVGLYIIMFFVYLLIRGIIQMKDHDARKNMIINIVSVIAIFVILICGLRSCMIAISDLSK